MKGILILVLGFLALSGAELTSDEVQALAAKLDEIHGVLERLRTDLESEEKRNHVPGHDPPAADPADPELVEYEGNLSQGDKALLNKMQSKIKYLEEALHEPYEANPGEPLADEREVRNHEDEFIRQLPADVQEMLKRHPSIRENMEKAMHEQGPLRRNFDDKAVQAEKEVKAREQDDEFTRQLPADVQDMLKRHPSVRENMEKAMAAKGPLRRNLEDQAAELTRGFMDGLSDEDKALVAKHQSLMDNLQTAADSPGHTTEEEMANEAEKRSEDPAKEFMRSLTTDDKSLLRKMKSQLTHLRTALRELKEPRTDLEEEVECRNCQPGEETEKRDEDPGKEFMRSLTDDDKALLIKMKSQVTHLHTALREMKEPRTDLEEVECRDCQPGKERECKNCPEREECEDCDKRAALNDVKQRLINDVRYAKERGLSLKDLIAALSNRRKRGV